jgi:segregation and condensation protein B
MNDEIQAAAAVDSEESVEQSQGSVSAHASEQHSAEPMPHDERAPVSEPDPQATPEAANEGDDMANVGAADAADELKRAKLILEAALLSSSEPLALVELKRLFDRELSSETLRKLLEDLRADWSGRAVELTAVASGWRFRVRPEFAGFVQRMNPEKPPRYSRAVMETLAIIAYRQPCTRGDIEQIRGVTVSTQIIKALEERAWIEAVGHKEVPGRPALYSTTKNFLDDLNLRSLEELPPLHELQATLDMTTETSSASEPIPTVQPTSAEATPPIVETEPPESEPTHAPDQTRPTAQTPDKN